jgi:hypothetical protein
MKLYLSSTSEWSQSPQLALALQSVENGLRERSVFPDGTSIRAKACYLLFAVPEYELTHYGVLKDEPEFFKAGVVHSATQHSEAFWFLLDLRAKRLVNYAADASLSTMWKVRDEGAYAFLDASFEVLAGECGYVPDFFPEKHFGDYIQLEISKDGLVKNWPNWETFELKEPFPYLDEEDADENPQKLSASEFEELQIQKEVYSELLRLANRTV